MKTELKNKIEKLIVYTELQADAIQGVAGTARTPEAKAALRIIETFADAIQTDGLTETIDGLQIILQMAKANVAGVERILYCDTLANYQQHMPKEYHEIYGAAVDIFTNVEFKWEEILQEALKE